MRMSILEKDQLKMGKITVMVDLNKKLMMKVRRSLIYFWGSVGWHLWKLKESFEWKSLNR